MLPGVLRCNSFSGSSCTELDPDDIVPAAPTCCATVPTSIAPAQLAMDPVHTTWPSSLKLRSRSRFGDLLRRRVFGVVRGRYFEDQWRQRQPMAMRQDIPPEHFWSGEDVVKHWEHFASLFLVVVSYPWLTAAHPDPDLWHLERLARLVALQRSFSSRFSENHHLGPFECEDIGVIIDWCSMWQMEGEGGEDRRRLAQIEEFKLCLAEINTPYGHEAVGCWVLESVPEHVPRKYNDRGWTFFEKSIIDMKAGWHEMLQTTIVCDDSLLATDHRKAARRFFSPSGGRGDRLRGLGTIMVPERFGEELEKRSQRAKAKGVILFTNGYEDRPLVLRKYRDAFELLAREAHVLQFGGRVWTPLQIDYFVEALPHFSNLQQVFLEETKIGREGGRRLRAALQAMPTVSSIRLHGCRLGAKESLLLPLLMFPRLVRIPDVDCLISFCICSCTCSCCCNGCCSGCYFRSGARHQVDTIGNCCCCCCCANIA